jgi:hypothetical protein
MTESQDEAASAPLAPVSKPAQAEAVPASPAGSVPAQAAQANPAAPVPIVVATPSADQLNKLVSHPLVKGYLGKSLKLIALFAILGCCLMLAAITALSSIINNALPH